MTILKKDAIIIQILKNKGDKMKIKVFTVATKAKNDYVTLAKFFMRDNCTPEKSLQDLKESCDKFFETAKEKGLENMPLFEEFLSKDCKLYSRFLGLEPETVSSGEFLGIMSEDSSYKIEFSKEVTL